MPSHVLESHDKVARDLPNQSPSKSGSREKHVDRERPTKDGEARTTTTRPDETGLKDYVGASRSGHGRGNWADQTDQWQQLGDCLGKGAFGSVYRALNWGTGETVAVKKVKLADLPKSELRVIMVRGLDQGVSLGDYMLTRWCDSSRLTS